MFIRSVHSEFLLTEDSSTASYLVLLSGNRSSASIEYLVVFLSCAFAPVSEKVIAADTATLGLGPIVACRIVDPM